MGHSMEIKTLELFLYSLHEYHVIWTLKYEIDLKWHIRCKKRTQNLDLRTNTLLYFTLEN